MTGSTISEKNAVLNYAIQTRRIADTLKRPDVATAELQAHERAIFKEGRELVENLLLGACYVYSLEVRGVEALTFLGLRDFRIGYTIFEKLDWTQPRENIVHNLMKVMGLLDSIVAKGVLSFMGAEDLSFLTRFFEELSARMHEVMLANKLSPVENYSSELWPKEL